MRNQEQRIEEVCNGVETLLKRKIMTTEIRFRCSLKSMEF